MCSRGTGLGAAVTTKQRLDWTRATIEDLKEQLADAKADELRLLKKLASEAAE